MKKLTEKRYSEECLCPLLDMACPQGTEVATHCRLKVNAGFDPLRSFLDLSILECAREQAAKIGKQC